jgi:glucan 1,3-beta-glucosidase
MLLGQNVLEPCVDCVSPTARQFTMRNLTFYNSVTAIQQMWDWGWTYKGVSINNCSIGFNIATNTGSVTILDSQIANTNTGIVYGGTSTPVSNDLVFENLNLKNVPIAIQSQSTVVLPGSSGTMAIAGWAKGTTYTPNGPNSVTGPITPNVRPASLTSGTSFYQRSRPSYVTVTSSNFLSIRGAGAAGDGKTDDTAKINAALSSAVAANQIVYFDAGVYLVTGTIKVPPGAKIFGEAFPVLLSSGAFFADMTNPKPVVQIGSPGTVGAVEISNLIISTQGTTSRVFFLGPFGDSCASYNCEADNHSFQEISLVLLNPG